MRCFQTTVQLILNFAFLFAWKGYEEYFILPENSAYCQDYQAYRRFSLSRQMSFTTGIYNASWNQLLYVCKVRIYPNGRLLHYVYPQGHTSYWFHRLRVDIRFASCGDTLTIGFIPEETTQQLLQPEELRLTCGETFPKIFDSRHRLISLAWRTETGSTDSVTSQLDVQMSSYMRFDGSFGISDKIQRCEAGSGFWCGNETAVCIYGQMRCDQADGCFDGGTDEEGCPPPRNYSSLQPPLRKPWGGWTTYVSWTAICLIPLALIFVLGMICTPRKNLDDSDEEETNHWKRHSRFSHSSATPTASVCDSPRSTHSVIVPSCSKIHLPISRASSNPETLALVSLTSRGIVQSAECDRKLHNPDDQEHITLRSSEESIMPKVRFQALPSYYRTPRGLINQPSTSPTVGLIKKGDCKDLLSDKQRDLKVHENQHSVKLEPPAALPAHFEMASLRIHENYALRDTKQSNSSSSSTDSYLEDVTPFRRPDVFAKTLPNGQSNGEISSKSSSQQKQTIKEQPTLLHPLSK